MKSAFVGAMLLGIALLHGRHAMRVSLFAFLLGAPLAFGQAGTSAAFDPGSLGKMLSPWTATERDFSKLPRRFTLMEMPFTQLYRPAPKPLIPLGDASIDPQIIVHPPQSGTASQPPPGTAITQNQFRGLEYLPIQWPQAKIEPIPITWANLQIKEASTALPPGRVPDPRIPGRTVRLSR
jgi:hypothetical protein